MLYIKEVWIEHAHMLYSSTTITFFRSATTTFFLFFALRKFAHEKVIKIYRDGLYSLQDSSIMFLSNGTEEGDPKWDASFLDFF